MAKSKLGSGARFKEVERQASVGMKKYGKKRMGQLAAMGRAHKKHGG